MHKLPNTVPAGANQTQTLIRPTPHDKERLKVHFKLIITLVDDNKTERVMEAARQSGATGATIITSARGEGVERAKTFLGLSLETQRGCRDAARRRTFVPSHS
jgi:hypothetical protein